MDVPRHLRPFIDASVAFNRNVQNLASLLTLIRDGGVSARDHLRKRAPETPTTEKPGDDFKRASAFAFLWQAVMLVTFTESFLEDVLAAAAELDPALMKDSEQSLAYPELVHHSSLEEAMDTLRRRWARNVLDRGGPAALVDRLRRMGASGIPGGHASTLEELWGVRHVVVHHAGIATLDFVRRHPDYAATAGGVIVPGPERLGQYLKAVSDLVNSVTVFFDARFSDWEPPTGPSAGAA